MTQEEKQLLLKDLCARLPYGVICTDLRHGDSKITDIDTEDNVIYCFDFDEWVKVENCRLYLRPMSSMTYKEKNRYDILVEETVYRPGVLTCSSLINFCHEHHLDNIGLIEKGLALEAPNGMYKTE